MEHRLSSKSQTELRIAELLISENTLDLSISVAEEQAFAPGQALALGVLSLKAQPGARETLLDAIRIGHFEWQIPEVHEVENCLKALLEIKETNKQNAKEQRNHERATDRVRRILDAVAYGGMRLGLTYPRFDAHSLASMPFRRASTVVADTSGVLQGALDFVSRFLRPVVRIKVPAIVHMEIVNQADRFLSERRALRPNPSMSARSGLLLEHSLSQAAQRVLLRLELQPDTEIERHGLFGDPLRNAFQHDGDPEWSELNLSVPLHNYCDRLIVEAARQHQSQVAPGHPVLILTSDQGLARMALAEGLEPLFFQSVKSTDFFGRLLTGINFNPFLAQLHTISLADILWELATMFGKAYISNATESRALEIAAMGDNLTWAPFHSRDDLLWVRLLEEAPPKNVSVQPLDSDLTFTSGTAQVFPSDRDRQPTLEQARIARPVFYRFNPSLMLSLIELVWERQKLNETEAQAHLNFKDPAAISDYRRFLTSGQFIDVADKDWQATDHLGELWSAFRTLNHDSVARLLKLVPSFSAFIQELEVRRIIENKADIPFSRRALSTYQILAEVACLGASIADEGFFETAANPKPTEFAKVAVRRFSELANGEGLVSVGLWLESLIRHDHIHPIVARERLHEADSSGALRVLTEGSTTDTRHDDHLLRVLILDRGKPAIQTVHLYRGDFLIPTKASVSLRLEEISS